MRFRVRRSGDWAEEECPVSGAIRDSYAPGWFIELHTLQDLLNLLEPAAPKGLVVSQIKEGYEVEIYDDWRE